MKNGFSASQIMPQIRDLIREMKEVYQIHPDFIISSIFSAVATAVGKRLTLTDPKGYANTTALWWCHIAPSGYGKTSATAQVLKPLMAEQTRLHKKYKAELKAWEESGEKKESSRPKEKKIFVSDTTPEAQWMAMEANPDGLLLYRDEIAGWIRDFGRYNSSGEVQNNLSAWSQTPIEISRVKGSIYVEQPNFNVLGGIQPSCVADVFGAGELTDNGFCARICWVAPEIEPRQKYSKRAISATSVDWWHGYIRQLMGLAEKNIHMSSEAEELYIAYWEDVQQKLNAEEQTWMQQSLAKLQIIVERIALIYWVLSARNYQENYATEELDADSMRNAIETCRTLEASAEKVWELINNRTQSGTITAKQSMILELAEQGLSQKEIARRLCTSSGYVNRVLRGPKGDC